jgi:cysteinyl-tRNA synthetase
MIKLYNTLSRSVEEFKPIEPGKVKMYCCGPTVYNYQHIGNMRTFFFEDILKRVLLYNRFEVFHVMNITDVGHLTSDEDSGDDKMEASAKEQGKTVWDIAKFYTDIFLKDMGLLNNIPPNVYCKASDYIKEQVEMIQCLEQKGFTYVTGDGVYYDTSKFPDYTKLAKLDIKGMQQGARVEFNEEKKNITDFALWKFSPKNEKRQMEWDSPWGTGFPGWHIECSAMSKKFLGNHFDIHCGGIDHIPVHHTNEIAQSEACNGEKFVNYWLHGEFLDLGDEKMSKSLGNIITLQTLMDNGYTPMHYRYYMLNAHYRKKLKFNFDGLNAARNGFESLKQRVLRLKQDAGEITPLPSETDVFLNYEKRFINAVNDDLNVTQGLAVLWDALKDEGLTANERLSLAYKFDMVFGLEIEEMKEEDNSLEIPDEIIELVEKRKQAKINKDFKLADTIREEIKAKGFEVVDKKEGVEIRSL